VEEILSEGIAQRDARGSVDLGWHSLRFVCQGNLGDWQGVLEDTQHCIKFETKDPMPYFWKGVAMRNLLSADTKNTTSNLVECRGAFRHFIKIAPPEERKVCEAWWNLAWCQMQTLPSPEVGKFEDGETITIVGLQEKPHYNGRAEL